MKSNLVTTLIYVLAIVHHACSASQKPLVRPAEEDLSPSSLLTSELERYIQRLLQEWHVPGMSIAIVDGNKTWAKGYGYAVLPDIPATPHTLWYTGSTTKSFTAAAVSQLIDNSSSLSWTTPVSSVLRDDFVLSDDWATAHITLEDCLCHRTGYPRHDLASSKTAKEVVRNLRNLPLSAEPRAKFQYNNQMFATMGYLVEVLSGLPLTQYFHKYLWEPMGMTETFLGAEDAAAAISNEKLVMAHEYLWNGDSGSYDELPVERENLMPYAGAGAVISNVLDYSKYLRHMMSETGPISKAGHKALKTPRSIMPPDQMPFSGPVWYGLGWMGATFEGEQVIFHSGKVNMFITSMVMIPSKNFALVAVSNSDTPVPEIITYRIACDYFGVPDERRIDFESRAKEEEKVFKDYVAQCPRRLYPVLPDPPLPLSLPLKKYTGIYSNPGYGNVTLEIHSSSADGHPGEQTLQVLPEGSHALDAMKLYSELEHKSGDFFVAIGKVEDFHAADDSINCMRAQFSISPQGVATHFAIDLRREEEDGPLVWYERVN